MTEPLRQDDPVHIPALEELAARPAPRRRRQRLVAFAVVAAALLVPATAAAAAADHHGHHPHLAVALVVPTPGERYPVIRPP